MVDDGHQGSGETHDRDTLGQTKGEELVPAGLPLVGVVVLSSCPNDWD